MTGFMTPKKILCPTDFSPGSAQAIRAAVNIAKTTSGEIVLVHASYLPPSALIPEWTFPTESIEQLGRDADRELAAAEAEARKLGAQRVSRKVVDGLPWRSICDAAEELAADLIVVGTHGRTGLARVLLGSVATMVIRHAPCSVLAVRGDDKIGPYRHILCPTDFSDPARHAIAAAAEFAERGGAGIMLLHVAELPAVYAGDPFLAYYRELEKRTGAMLDKAASELRAKTQVPVATRARVGHPGAQILEELEADRSYDLVVVGSHGHTGIARALLGSVAEKVARQAHCPVLVAREH